MSIVVLNVRIIRHLELKFHKFAVRTNEICVEISVCGAGISSSCFLVAVLLTGGVVGVAGQFRGWQFAAYAVYPL